MKNQKTTNNICILTILTFGGLLVMASTSLAAEDTWTKRANMPTWRATLSTCVVDGVIYAIGGAKSGSTGLSIVEAYDPVTNSWMTKTDMPTARKYLSSSAVDGKIYSIGGLDGAVIFATVEEYDTGFVPPPPETTKVDTTGKLSTTWGKIKHG